MSAVRIALTAVLAAALLAVALPAVDAGRVERTTTALDATADRIERAGTHLRTVEDPTAPDIPGARAVVTVEVPRRSWHAAGVAYVAVGGQPGGDGGADAVVYRIEGESRQVVAIDVPVRTPDGPVVFRSPGRHRLTLSLVRDDGVAVVASRAGVERGA